PPLLLVAADTERRVFAIDGVLGGPSGPGAAGAGASVRVVAGAYPDPVATPGLARFQPDFGVVAGVAFDAATRTVYVSERDQNRVDAIGIVDDSDASTWTLSRVAGSSTGEGGARDGDASTSLLRGPTGL